MRRGYIYKNNVFQLPTFIVNCNTIFSILCARLSERERERESLDFREGFFLFFHGPKTGGGGFLLRDPRPISIQVILLSFFFRLNVHSPYPVYVLRAHLDKPSPWVLSLLNVSVNRIRDRALVLFFSYPRPVAAKRAMSHRLVAVRHWRRSRRCSHFDSRTRIFQSPRDGRFVRLHSVPGPLTIPATRSGSIKIKRSLYSIVIF